MTKNIASVDPSEAETAPTAASEDELIRRATADRAAGRNTSSDVDALLGLAAEQNRAALDRLAK